MPLYKFELREGSAPLSDDSGVDLLDDEHALAYAKDIARELMRGREVQTRCWRLDVYENDGELMFALPFAGIDHTLDHLAPELRSMLERVCNSYRSWQEAVHGCRVTLRESRALIAQSQGKPYLAAVSGQRTIR